MTTAAVSGAISTASTIAIQTIDIFVRLRESFKLSESKRKRARECQKEIQKLVFKQFKEKYSCKRVKGIALEDFETFAARMKKTLSLPDDVMDSLLDGLYTDENEEKLSEFEFRDGKGDIHHGRFITVKQNGKIDVAYAVYSLSFQLEEKYVEKESYYYFLYFLPIDNTTYTKEAQNLSEDQKHTFSEWCQVKLYDCVAQECSDE